MVVYQNWQVLGVPLCLWNLSWPDSHQSHTDQVSTKRVKLSNKHSIWLDKSQGMFRFPERLLRCMKCIVPRPPFEVRFGGRKRNILRQFAQSCWRTRPDPSPPPTFQLPRFPLLTPTEFPTYVSHQFWKEVVSCTKQRQHKIYNHIIILEKA